MEKTELSKKIKKYIWASGRNVTEIAEELNKDRSYISKFMHGYYIPPLGVIDRFCDLLDLTLDQKRELVVLAGYLPITSSSGSPGFSIKNSTPANNFRKGVINMEKQNIKEQDKIQPEIKIPDELNVLYTDSVFVTSNSWGIVLDIAQTVGPTNRQNVVVRVGMSKDHAKALAELMLQHVAKKRDGAETPSPVQNLV